MKDASSITPSCLPAITLVHSAEVDDQRSLCWWEVARQRNTGIVWKALEWIWKRASGVDEFAGASCMP
jgi:hypothetical protein